MVHMPTVATYNRQEVVAWKNLAVVDHKGSAPAQRRAGRRCYSRPFGLIEACVARLGTECGG
jgi:hypothetical protein